MINNTNDLKAKFNSFSILEKFIVVNVVIFIIGLLLKLFGLKLSLFELPSDAIDFILQPWSILTYAFLHYDFIHILFNMLWLYFVGQYFLNVFSTRLAVNVYLLGAIGGGLLYLLAYNVLPGFDSAQSRLVGASASVRALMIFLCTYLAATEVRLFTVNIKLWHIGAVLVLIDFAGVFGSNSGGNIAHLGGAALGYFYAVQYKKGIDIGKGFGKGIDYVVKLFSFKKSTPFKTVHKTSKKGKMAGFSKEEFNSFNNQKRIDLILDKISKSGYDSLTKEEKEFLFKSGK